MTTKAVAVVGLTTKAVALVRMIMEGGRGAEAVDATSRPGKYSLLPSLPPSWPVPLNVPPLPACLHVQVSIEGLPASPEWPTWDQLRRLLRCQPGRPINAQDIEEDVYLLQATGATGQGGPQGGRGGTGALGGPHVRQGGATGAPGGGR